MTLNITIVNQWGIWQCSDLRLTAWPSGEVKDDNSLKHVSVRATDGAALITYTGLGKFKGDHVSGWLRRTIRGESRTVEATLNQIRDQATAQLGNTAAKLGIHHTFRIGAFLSGWACAFLITNMDPADPLGNPPLPRFTGTARMVHAYGPQAMIAGARGAVAQSDVALLSSIAMMKPKRPVDYSRLLAEVNRRASKQRPFGKLISEACVTTYIPPTGEPFQHQKHFWGLARATNEKVVPMTLFGIDLTEWSQIMMDNFRTLIDPNAAVREEAEKRVDRLMLKANQRAVRP